MIENQTIPAFIPDSDRARVEFISAYRIPRISEAVTLRPLNDNPTQILIIDRRNNHRIPMDIHIGRVLRQATVDSILAVHSYRATGLDDDLLDDA